jgi:hypothetical protein
MEILLLLPHKITNEPFSPEQTRDQCYKNMLAPTDISILTLEWSRFLTIAKWKMKLVMLLCTFKVGFILVEFLIITYFPKIILGIPTCYICITCKCYWFSYIQGVANLQT